LPDGLGIFKPKTHFWYILEGLWMQILIYFMIIWCYTLWPFTLLRGNLVHILCGLLLYYPHFGILYQEKSGNPAAKMTCKFFTEPSLRNRHRIRSHRRSFNNRMLLRLHV
jgi:uncharacterized membrane protein